MVTFAFIHGAGDSGWAWHLVEAELRARGHVTVAPDLPSEDDSCGIEEYTETVVEAVRARGSEGDVVVVGHSFGGFTAPLVAERLGARRIVLLAGMIPSTGESPAEWWSATGYAVAAATQAARDDGATGSSDPMIAFYNGVPDALAREAMRRSRRQSDAPTNEPWPLAAWPDVPTRFVLCRDDRFFPADFFRALVPERLGITPEEIDGGHCVMLSRPREVADAVEDGGR